jgi:hypothetical protein
VGDGKPLGAHRDVAESTAQMSGHGRHVARAEYHAYPDRFGRAIMVNLVEHACQPGISYGPNVVFQHPVKPAAGQVLRALVVSFRLFDAPYGPGIDKLPAQPDDRRPGSIDHAGLELLAMRFRLVIQRLLPAHRHA